MTDYRSAWSAAVRREIVPDFQLRPGQDHYESCEAQRACAGFEAIGYESSNIDAVRAVIEQEACIEALVGLEQPALAQRLLTPLTEAAIRGGMFPNAWEPDDAFEPELALSPGAWMGRGPRFDVCLVRVPSDAGAAHSLQLIEVGNDSRCWARDDSDREVLVLSRVAAAHAVAPASAARRRNWLLWLGSGSLGVYRRQLDDIANTRRRKSFRDIRHRIVDVHVLVEGARLLLRRALDERTLSTALCALAIEDVRAALSSLRRHAGVSDPEPAGVECCSGLSPSLAYDELTREVSS